MTTNPTTTMTTNPTATVERVADRMAYARNGNAHRPTTYYRYEVHVGGVLMGSFARRRDALAALPAMVAEHAERVAARAARGEA